MPVYDKPMIYYPLSILMQADIREVLIITTPRDLETFKSLLGDGSQWGMKFEYKIQEKPNGLAEAFIIGEDFIGQDNVAMILGDNMFYGEHLAQKLKEANERENEATIFGYYVKDPRASCVPVSNHVIPLPNFSTFSCLLFIYSSFIDVISNSPLADGFTFFAISITSFV